VGTSVRQVLDVVKRISGSDFLVKQESPRPGDAPMLVADITRATSVLGWTPTRSDLDTIVRTAWNWHKGLVRKS